MSFDEDPEVIADMQLRAYTERDTTRARETPKWNPPKITGQVPCRARCGNLADWTQEAEDAFVTFNLQLTAHNEAPLDKTRIVFCPSCVSLGKKLSADSNRNKVERVRGLIQKLKASPNPESEHDTIRELDKLSHPNLKGLLESLREKLTKAPGKRAGKDAAW